MFESVRKCLPLAMEKKCQWFAIELLPLNLFLIFYFTFTGQLYGQKRTHEPVMASNHIGRVLRAQALGRRL